METFKIDEALKFVRNTKKKFPQTFDLVITLKNIDLRKPENKISKEVLLPHGTGKNISVCLISDSHNKTENYDVINKGELGALAKNKKMVKNIARKYDFFISEIPLMAVVGKTIGRYLGPLGKMPSPIPPNMKNVDGIVNSKKKSVRMKIRDSPTLYLAVGKETMSDEQVKENIKKVIETAEQSLPKGRTQMKNVFLKLTMSKPVRVEI